MSKKNNFLWVMVAFGMDAVTAYMWYIVLFPTEPVTTFEAVLVGGLLTIFTSLIIGLNWAIFSTSLAEGN